MLQRDSVTPPKFGLQPAWSTVKGPRSSTFVHGPGSADGDGGCCRSCRRSTSRGCCRPSACWARCTWSSCAAWCLASMRTLRMHSLPRSCCAVASASFLALWGWHRRGLWSTMGAGGKIMVWLSTKGGSIFFGVLNVTNNKHLRHLQTAPQFMTEPYDTDSNRSWAFAGFNFARASFYPEGRRTAEAAGSLCGSSLAGLPFFCAMQWQKERVSKFKHI